MNQSFLCQCYPQSSQNILWLMEELSHWSCLRFYKPTVYGKFSLYAVPFQGWEEVSCFTVLILWDKQANIIIKCWQASRVSLSADSIEQQILSRWGSPLRSRGKGVPCITLQLTFGCSLTVGPGRESRPAFFSQKLPTQAQSQGLEEIHRKGIFRTPQASLGHQQGCSWVCKVKTT